MKNDEAEIVGITKFDHVIASSYGRTNKRLMAIMELDIAADGTHCYYEVTVNDETVLKTPSYSKAQAYYNKVE